MKCSQDFLNNFPSLYICFISFSIVPGKKDPSNPLIFLLSEMVNETIKIYLSVILFEFIMHVTHLPLLNIVQDTSYSL